MWLFSTKFNGLKWRILESIKRITSIFIWGFPPRDDLRVSNTTVILQKNYVVYWCWSKTWDEIEKFMLNAVKMVVWHVTSPVSYAISLVVQPLLRKSLVPLLRKGWEGRIFGVVLSKLFYLLPTTRLGKPIQSSVHGLVNFFCLTAVSAIKKNYPKINKNTRSKNGLRICGIERFLVDERSHHHWPRLCNKQRQCSVLVILVILMQLCH